MFFDIVLDLFLSDSAYGGTEIAACPEVLPPVPLAQMRELVLQLPRRGTLEILYDLGGTESRRTRPQHMHMVSTQMPFDDCDIPAHTYLTDYLPCAFSHFTLQHLVPILGHPHHMILNVIDSVRSLTILWHLTFNRRREKVILLVLRAKAIRLKAKVFDPVHGTKPRKYLLVKHCAFIPHLNLGF